MHADSQSISPLTCSGVLSHHWLVRERGGEKVLRALCRLLPGAALHTLVYDARGVNGGWPIVRTSWLNSLPGAQRYYPKYLPLMPLAARSMRLPPVDLVLCSDAAIAKAMRVHRHSKLVCYCHSPMRYIWDLTEEYIREVPWALRPLWGPLCAYLRRTDRRAAQRVDIFVANSKHVAERIRRHYGRGSVVVNPPVEIPDSPPRRSREDFYLCVGYHVGYKRLDLAVEACRRMGRRLVVIGEGPDVDRLDLRNNPSVELHGWLGADEISRFYARARALLFPGEEDFGIVPVEAIANGCPVIAYGVGGATETVLPDRTGVWFTPQTIEALIAAIRYAETISFDPELMHAHACRFGRNRFLREMRQVSERALNGERS